MLLLVRRFIVDNAFESFTTANSMIQNQVVKLFFVNISFLVRIQSSIPNAEVTYYHGVQPGHILPDTVLLTLFVIFQECE